MIAQRPAPNIRHAEVHHGDTLQRISLRELGDASRWVELVLLNELRPPGYWRMATLSRYLPRLQAFRPRKVWTRCTVVI